MIRKISQKWGFYLTGLIILGGSFFLYIRTLAPTILEGDGAEFQTLACTLGIAHTTGYPFYLMLGKLFTFLPVGDIAYRVNLMSAVCAAGAVFLAYFIMLRLVKNLPSAFLASIFLAISYTLWSQAIIAEVYTLNLLGVSLLLYLIFRWNKNWYPKFLSDSSPSDEPWWNLRKEPVKELRSEARISNSASTGKDFNNSPSRAIYPRKGKSHNADYRDSGQEKGGSDGSESGLFLIAFLWGLFLGNHLSIAFIAFPLAYLLIKNYGWGINLGKKVGVMAIFLALGFLPNFLYYYYCYAVSTPYDHVRCVTLPSLDSWNLSPGALNSFWSQTWFYLRGTQFRDRMFTNSPVEILRSLFLELPARLLGQFYPLGLMVGILGMVGMMVSRKGNRFLGRFLLIYLGANLFYILNYEIWDIEAYYLPVYLIFSIFMGFGWKFIFHRLSGLFGGESFRGRRERFQGKEMEVRREADKGRDNFGGHKEAKNEEGKSGNRRDRKGIKYRPSLIMRLHARVPILLATFLLFLLAGFNYWSGKMLAYRMRNYRFPLASLIAVAGNHPDLSQAYDASLIGRYYATKLPENAVVYSDWGRMYVLRYFVTVIDKREDVLIYEAYPYGPRKQFSYQKLSFIEKNIDRRPIYFTFYPRELALFYFITYEDGFYRLRRLSFGSQ